MASTSAFGWETPDDTDLVKDGAAAIRTLGNSIDTSMADLKGGTSGQVLSKASNTDMDFTWVAQDDSNAIQNAIVDAKGDLIAATANDTPARLAVGTNGHVLTADSAEATGLKWAAPAAGGMTQLATGSLSGTSVSITGLSTAYNELYIVFNAVSLSGADQPNFRFNGDNSGVYQQAANGFNGGATNAGGQSGILINTNVSAANTAAQWVISIPNYASTTSYKTGFWSAVFVQNAAAERTIGGVFGYFGSTSAITSVQFFASYGGSATFDNGTYTVYGVK